jgi:secondary thiamine-phosphate synthase enzyme
MVVTKKIGIRTRGECDLIDITAQVKREVSASEINAGTVTVFISGSTAGISTIEYESGLVSDFEGMCERVVPRNIPYQHDRRWGDGNGYSHVRASLIGPSSRGTIPNAPPINRGRQTHRSMHIYLFIRSHL